MLSNNQDFYRGAIDPTGCISNGWNLIKPNYGMYLGIAVLGWIMFSCIPCINILLFGPTMGGIYYVLLRDMRGEPVDFSMMFKGFEKFGQTLAVGILQMLPWIVWQIIDFSYNISSIFTNVGSGSFFQSQELIAGGIAIVYLIFAVFFFFFSIIWGISFSFALALVVDREIGPIDAIKLSARAAWSNLGGILVLGILLGLIALGGILALCLGVFFVLPIIYAAWAFAFRQVFPSLGGPDIKTAPPMPDEYGLSYGR